MKRIDVQVECRNCNGKGEGIYPWGERKGKLVSCWSCKGKGFVVYHETPFLCIGGPFNREYKSQHQVWDDYTIYNRSTRLAKTLPTAVLVWNGWFA